MRTLYISDLDGTLLNSHVSLNSYIIYKIIYRLVEIGHPDISGR